MAYSRKKETEILADAMDSASISLDEMAAALNTLGCQGLKAADAAAHLASVLGAYLPAQFMCPEHGIIEFDKTIYKTAKTTWRCERYCAKCQSEDKKWTRVYKWSDQLTRDDFEISPPCPKN